MNKGSTFQTVGTHNLCKVGHIYQHSPPIHPPRILYPLTLQTKYFGFVLSLCRAKPCCPTGWPSPSAWCSRPGILPQSRCLPLQLSQALVSLNSLPMDFISSLPRSPLVSFSIVFSMSDSLVVDKYCIWMDKWMKRVYENKSHTDISHKELPNQWGKQLRAQLTDQKSGLSRRKWGTLSIPEAGGPVGEQRGCEVWTASQTRQWPLSSQKASCWTLGEVFSGAQGVWQTY